MAGQENRAEHISNIVSEFRAWIIAAKDQTHDMPARKLYFNRARDRHRLIIFEVEALRRGLKPQDAKFWDFWITSTKSIMESDISMWREGYRTNTKDRKARSIYLYAMTYQPHQIDALRGLYKE